jgi:YYY domain-containing protein
MVLLIAAWFRFEGIDWGEDQHLHPDERFLTQVVSALRPVRHQNPELCEVTGFNFSSIGCYFDTARSPVNPNNRDFHFFVYGTLPIFLVRSAGEMLGQTGYDQVYLVGRVLSALADLGVVTLVYFAASRLFDKRVALLAAAFSAVSVMQIQQSHFWTVDNFVNFFSLLALYFAIRVASGSRVERKAKAFTVWDFVGFGVALGMALASKVSVAPLALALPAAVIIQLYPRWPKLVQKELIAAVYYTALAAGLSILVFRIFQPYAFVGIGLNPLWLDTMRSLSAQVTGDADWPPSMQWARRPIWFGFANIVRWGLGWPLASACWGGFIWAGWKLYKDGLAKPWAILWGWAAFYFVWQSIGFNPTMRYFLPVYPALAVFGAWGVISVWDAQVAKRRAGPNWQGLIKPAAVALGLLAALGGAAWAFAFVQIYNQDVSRIQAARWIYQNVPGPITLAYSTAGGEEYRQPLRVPYDQVIKPDAPYQTVFVPNIDGEISGIGLKYLLVPVEIIISSGQESAFLLSSSTQLIDLESLAGTEPREFILVIPSNVFGDLASEYQIQIRFPEGRGQLIIENARLRASQNSELGEQHVLTEPLQVSLGENVSLDFTLSQGLVPDQILLSIQGQTEIYFAPISLHLRLGDSPEMNTILFDGQVQVAPTTDKGGGWNSSTVEIEPAIPATQGKEIFLEIGLSDTQPIMLLGSAVANESSWDDGQPLRIDGYDGFGGIYQGDLNFEMYWDENADKLARYQRTLDSAEFIFITSSRQWGSLPRLPERFPLAVVYYQELLGCPDEKTIEWCYSVAQTGMFQGRLGFELIQVFENAPRLGSWKINDQFSEEAFTVYDHPKVFIFKKTETYNPELVAEIFSQVDLNKVVHLTPKQAGSRILPDLHLPAARWEQQRAGGTWSEIFRTDSWINASPGVTLFAWYAALIVLGLVSFPLVRLALPGLADEGYAFARLGGLVLLAYLAWIGGSVGLTFDRVWIIVFALILTTLGLWAAWVQRAELKKTWKARRSRFVRIELLFLAFFLLMLFIRLGNPDLWHPAKGGEKPMDFSYFNAVLKSTTFPPYDPWFAGGYINYYYYGFVLVGTFVKLLGIVPSVSYNLILPTLFAMLALGAYSVAFNLWSAWHSTDGKRSAISPEFVGLAAALGIVLLGNLGNLQMIFQGYLRLGSPEGIVPEGFLERFFAVLGGFVESLRGRTLPFGLGDWYWNPTRIIPALNESAPITEFPIFTFTYADLHAHLIALPVTLLALGWALSAILSRAWHGARTWRRVPIQAIWSFVFAAIVIGSLRPINTWDLPTYLLLAAIAAGYAIWKYGPRRKVSKNKSRPIWELAVGAPLMLGVLSILAYWPFALWYRQGYTSVELWQGTNTPSGPYLIHWGIFFFVTVGWLLWEAREWLDATPLSSLRKLEPYQLIIYVGILALLVTSAILWTMDVYVVWLAFPILVLAGMLLIRPKQPEAKRIILFLIGTGVFLTLLVEVIVLRGDISRMNTVFKFYMQAWVLIAIGAAFALAWTVDGLRAWLPSWRAAWQVGAAILLVSGGLFMLLGVTAKIRDRMSVEVPPSLDGVEYMAYSVYFDRDQALELSQDYEAIRWMQENVEGTPVIVEAHTGEYRWGSRFSIYTGLPSVVGWNWHQRQQREFVPGNDVWSRVYEVVGNQNDIPGFYFDTDLSRVTAFLREYHVKYIIVGQLEQAYYPGPGLDKFEAQLGLLWNEVFRAGDTVFYEVMDSALVSN